MTDAHARVTDAPTFRVYDFEHNAHFCNLVNAGRATLGTRGTDERGAYVLITLVPLATFAGGRR